jgi:putative endonuclease
VFYYTYVLESLKDKSIYVGYTLDLKKRVTSHNLGKNLSTKPHIPYRLIHFEGFLNRVDAKRREVYLKSGWGRKNLLSMLSRYFKIKP